MKSGLKARLLHSRDYHVIHGMGVVSLLTPPLVIDFAAPRLPEALVSTNS